MKFNELSWSVSQRQWLRNIMTPAARGFLRYWPLRTGKRFLWNEIVRPCFAWHPREFVARTRFRSLIFGNTRDVVQQCIYFFGIWEPSVTQWIGERLRPGDVFVDVGANIGYFSLLASKAVGATGRVVAIEASPLIFRSMENNFALNNARNIRAVNIAAADQPGKLSLFHGTDYNSGETTTIAGQGLDLLCEVDALPLTAILESNELQRARLIKMDIEGGEWSAISGIKSILPEMPPSLEWIIEMHPAQLKTIGRSAEDIRAVFEAAGYHAYYLQGYTLPADCIDPVPSVRPARLKRLIDEEMSVVFSRIDAQSL